MLPEIIHTLAIVGPTASGKSALALSIATAAPIEIVSCDSLMVYSGMDIGTGKPTRAERDLVPHHLLDVVSPAEPYHAARWAHAARRAIAGIAGRGRLPVIVGGTGLYLRALLNGLFEAPPPDEAIRERHREEARTLGVETLHARLITVDPETAARVLPRDLVRISRALEIFEQTGEPISVLRRRAIPPVGLTAAVVVLDPPLDRLRSDIARRFDAMMDAGLVEETRALRAAFGNTARPLQSLGYSQMGDFLDGRVGLPEAVAAAKMSTATYARRQRTFFRKQMGARREAEVPAAQDVLAWWRASVRRV